MNKIFWDSKLIYVAIACLVALVVAFIYYGEFVLQPLSDDYDISEYPIMINQNLDRFFCKTIDIETRIADNCIQLATLLPRTYRHFDKYALSAYDNWNIR